MKAYRLWIKDYEDAGMEIVFAENAKEAKKKLGELSGVLENYTDLRVNRDKRYDGMEKSSMAELSLKQWRDGWIWDESDCPDVDEATDKEFLDWYAKTYEWRSR